VSDQQVPVVRTAITADDYVRAGVRAGVALGMGILPEPALGVLYAQYMIETGGTNCFGWNIGNVKKVPGDGFDFHCLNGVWEGVSSAEAARLIASGEAVADPSQNHAKAVGFGRVSVIFKPPHPQTRFRAYPSLDVAMEHHLDLLAKKRFSSCWPSVLAGDVDGFAHALKAKGYFTADASAYANGMRPAFSRLVSSNAYEDLVATMDQAPTTEPVEVDAGEAHESPMLNDFVELRHDGATWLVCPIYVSPLSIGQARDLAAQLGCELPTPALVDAIWRAADLKLDANKLVRSHDGTPKTMDSEATHADQGKRIAKLIGDKSLGTDFRLLAGAFKDVVQKDGKVGLYGWHRANGTPIQPFYAGHAPTWRDYSQGLRLVRRA
jgi:hypothetical protein